ncbi:MAG: 2,3-bisphosphoglycerate-independent phosphoglycerate mutase [Anaerolineae bacterium]
MSDLALLRELSIPAESKIVFLIIDGLGGLPRPQDGLTELEAAHTPNLDRLAGQSICGLSVPVAPGITPGSGPGHLALFGYDPLVYQAGRGVLEALGIGFDLGPDDVAARGNFCTVDDQGRITDRRAGRIPSEKGTELCNLLRAIELPGVQVFVEPVKDYRFVLVLRGEGLSDALTETDPQRTGVAPPPMEATRPEAEPTARLFNAWIARARELLTDQHPANMVTLRGPSRDPHLPQVGEVFKLRAAAIAAYPMYRGVARLVGMEVLPTGEAIAQEFETLARHWEGYDFFFLHVKKTDSAGEDGDFARKAAIIEEVDELLPTLLALKPDVLVVTGDHSTPWSLRAHSWHPLPLLLHSAYCRPDGLEQFGERACARGSLGLLPARDIMPLALAHALRLQKFGA